MVTAAMFAASELIGCAAPPPAGDPDALAEFRELNDPLEPTNRAIYAIDSTLDRAVVHPVARAYRFVVPEAARNGVHNFLMNLGGPVRLMNDMLQGRPRRAGDSAMRLLINSTVGLLGIFDVAADWGYPYHGSDFGQTLAMWGAPEGPYLFLPLLGPSNLRDTVGIATDIAIDPFAWIGSGTTALAARGSWIVTRGIDARDRNGDLIDQTKATSLDAYAVFRSLYRQHQQALLEHVREDRRATVPIWFPRKEQ
jgi:phospholipid-binding lipoprotein MlaA